MLSRKNRYEIFKRGIDIIGSGIGLVVLSPVIGAVGLAVRIKHGSPIIFRQQRPGKDGKIFTIYKFRTMQIINAHDDVGSDEQRITTFGQKLRSSSLDELPSLINVFKGDMSFVGPRPLLVEYLPLYSAEQWRRHEVRPGITGLAQINGRNEVSWENKFSLDIAYVNQRSLKLDTRILLRTLTTVFTRKGISKRGQVTTDKFEGSTNVG